MRLEVLANGIVNAHLEKNQDMDMKTAMEVAETVLAHFGYGSFCLGNNLMPDEREVFYELEDLGILKSSSRVEPLSLSRNNRYHASEWRTFEWEINERKVNELQHVVFVQEVRPEEFIYEAIPASAFSPDSDMREDEARAALRPGIQKKYVMVQKTGSEQPGESKGNGPTTREKIESAMNAGKTISEISEELGLTKASVYYHAARIRKSAPKRTKGSLIRKRIRDLLEGGMSPHEITLELNMKRKTVSKYVTEINKENGTPGKTWTPREDPESGKTGEERKEAVKEPQSFREEYETVRRERDVLLEENIRLRKKDLDPKEGNGIEIRIRVPDEILRLLIGKLEAGN